MKVKKTKKKQIKERCKFGPCLTLWSCLSQFLAGVCYSGFGAVCGIIGNVQARKTLSV